MNHAVFASCAKGLEYLLENELAALGLKITRVGPQGVYGEGSLAVLYKLCLWSRIANRIQLLLFSGEVLNEEDLYKTSFNFPWQTVFTQDKTLAIEFHGSSAAIRNTMFGAQVVKDAIVDYFRKLTGERPAIDRENPEIRIHVHLKNDRVQLSFDLTGYSLHQRGYRTEAGEAPLKETLAAAMLMRAKWPELAEQGYAFQDPMCGSGTLVIEAAMMAALVAPGLMREDQAFIHWVSHDPVLWDKTRTDALSCVQPPLGKIRGSDKDPYLIKKAIANATRAGVLSMLDFQVEALKDCRPVAKKGLLLCNPPYGQRLDEEQSLMPLYQEFGRIGHDYFEGWEGLFLTSNPLLAKATGLRSSKQYTLYNGALPCKLYCLEFSSANKLKTTETKPLSDAAMMVFNRLQKNKKNLAKWAEKNTISCYRVYDADLPEYAWAIDIYHDHAVLQEYAPPASIPAEKAEMRGLDLIAAVPAALNLAKDKLVIKQRKKQKGKEQYEKLTEKKAMLPVTEGEARLFVNLHDYIDTGLFLDHRLLRRKLGTFLPGTRFLNLFCYTATASVHAALAGALTTNIDLSNTYLDWARKNFELNSLETRKHQFIQADCIVWLRQAKAQFDVILLDPPSFSNSKRMSSDLDVQRDHVALITTAMSLLATGGELYFSTNLRKFKLDEVLNSKFSIKDISASTIDLDFKRNPRIHQCFILSHFD